jgi:outer membrane protein assembly factor BamD (BamD/ComL family)
MRHARRIHWLLAAACGFAALGGGRLVAAETPEQLLASAKQAFDRKDFSRARRLAQRVVDKHPASAVVVDAWLVVVDSLLESQEHTAAFEQCEKLLEAHPQTKYRTAVLRREFEIGQVLAASQYSVAFVRFKRLQEGVKILERVIEHAPFGTLADRAVYAIGEAYFHDGDYEAARDQYDRLLKHYPNSELIIRARVRRATCNQKLVAGSPYDMRPVEQAKADMDVLVKLSGNKEVAAQAAQMGELLAQGDYETGLFYFGRANIEGGVRYMKAVINKYPDSEYAGRARRILEFLGAEAKSQEKP